MMTYEQMFIEDDEFWINIVDVLLILWRLIRGFNSGLIALETGASYTRVRFIHEYIW